jgi:hypothetical protein
MVGGVEQQGERVSGLQEAQTMAQMTQNMGSLLDALVNLGYVGALVAGALAAVKLKAYVDNPAQATLSSALGMMVMSGVMLTTPFLLKEAQDGLLDSSGVAAYMAEPARARVALVEPGQEALAAREKADAAKKEFDQREALAKADAAGKTEAAKARFEAAERSASSELAAKGLGGASAQSTESTSGDGGAWGLILGALAALGAAGLGWAKRASKRIRRESDQLALPVVDLGASSSRREI